MSEDDSRRVRERAHRLWEEQGRPEGLATDHWHQAEREIREEAGQGAVEGEGSYTGARDYNEATTDFAQSGKVESAVQDAADALDDPAQAADMQKAEAAGKQRSRGEDPTLRKKA